MVRMENESREDRFDDMVRQLVREHGLRLDVTGWTRKTFDIYDAGDRHATRRLLLRVESFAMTNGEIELYDPEALPLAEAIGTALERDFAVKEAVIRRHERPR